MSVIADWEHSTAELTNLRSLYTKQKVAQQKVKFVENLEYFLFFF